MDLNEKLLPVMHKAMDLHPQMAFVVLHVFRRGEQENQKFKVIKTYTVSSRVL